MGQTISGLEKIKQISIKKFPGRIGLLTHNAVVDGQFQSSMQVMLQIFGERLTTFFSPQHGIVGDVQDNMVESDHFFHPYFQRQVYSLYSETREPTEQMLKDVDIVFVDLQDVGTRVYTYIYTLILMMKKCGELDKKVVVLDRANPLGGQVIEGNTLESGFESFVGMLPLPMRHGLTIGEIGLMANQLWGYECDYEVITLEHWQREQLCTQSQFWPHWINPSPNLPTATSAMTFPATVLFEGTNLSEGRGTTRSLEVFGHPQLAPYAFYPQLQKALDQAQLTGFHLRAISFLPTFQKHAGKNCGGYQIHITNPQSFRPWALGQILCRELYHALANDFKWKQPPYEYNDQQLPIDLINGCDWPRKWVENNGSSEELMKREEESRSSFSQLRSEFLLY